MSATCRFCHAWTGVMLRYGPRHYAHLACGVQKHGREFINKLNVSQLSKVPFRQAQDLGVFDLVKARYDSLTKPKEQAAR